ncbi:MAG: tetratricopeptide repeat protein [Sphingobium sp.]
MRLALYSITALASLTLTAIPVLAQTLPVETRVGRLEKEMKAVQRKVFPGGTPVEPDITATPVPSTALPSSTPVTDLIARVDSLETQLATLTGQTEQNSFRLKQLEANFARYKADMDARFPPVASADAPTATPQPAIALATPASATPKPETAATPKPPKAVATPAGDARKAAVAAIEVPNTGKDAEDSFTYGYRLWNAKFYPEAQTQLKATVEKYGSGSIGSRAQNLLGRAYLDDGKPALAAVALYENYQKRPNGDRAAESLGWLGEALIQLKKPADACKVYDQMKDTYGASLSTSLKTMMDKGRVRAKCGA